jgi:lambda family phage tail tape measure protein
MAMDMSVVMRIAASVSGGSSVDDLRKSVERLNTSAGGMEGAFKKAALLVKGFIGIEAVRMVANYSSNLIQMGDQLDELSQRTGTSATTLSSLSQSAQQSGVSLEGVATGMKKLSVQMVEAQNGSKEAAKGFKALGLDPKQFKSSEEALYAIADRFKDMEDGANKVAIAQALMGKSGEANIPWLNQGSEAMRKFGSMFSPQFIGMSAKFSDLLDEMGFNSKKFAANALESLLPALSDIVKSFNDTQSKGKEFQVFWDALAEGLRLVAAAAQTTITGFKQLLEIVNTAIDWGKLFGSGEFNKAGERLKSGYEDILRIGKEGNERIAALMKNSLIFGQGSAEEIRARQIEAAGGNAEPDKKNKFKPDMGGFGGKDADADKLAKFRLEQEASIKKRKEELEAVNMSTVEYQKLTAAREFELKVAQLRLTLSDSGKAQLDKEKDAIKEQTLAMIELEYQTKRTFEYGAKSAIKSYAEDLGNVAKQTQEAMTKAFKGMEDALVSFVTTGKLDFKSLANSIIQDLIRITVRTMILKPLMSSFGFTAFADGGIMTGAGEMPLKKYATGGIASSPQLAMFGEGSQPEAFVPLPDGRTIPVTMNGGGSTNNVTVNVSVDGSNSSAQASGTEAAQLGNAISKAVQNELIKQQRPGGLLFAR